MKSDDVKDLLVKMMEGSTVELKSIENEAIESTNKDGWAQLTPTGRRVVTIVIGE